jgi:capsular polysaccharide biosynthesis protein
MVKRKSKKIDFISASTLEALFHSDAPCFFPVVPARAPSGNTLLLFPEEASPAIIAAHYAAPSPAPLGLAVIPDVLVSGRSFVGTEKHVYLLNPLVPKWVDNFIDSGRRADDTIFSEKIKKNAPPIPFLLTHWNSHAYGHWIQEGFLQMLLLRHLKDLLPPFSILTPKITSIEVTRWAKLILPDVPIAVFDEKTEYVHCERLFMTTLLFSASHSFHPLANELIDEIRTLTNASGRATGRSFITRPTAGSVRRLSNQSEIETIAVERGLTLVAPENLSIVDQIKLFAQSGVIVGEYGSGMHNTLFSTSRALVLCLNYMDICQSRISQLRGYRVGYILPSHGKPVTWAEGAPLQEFHIDPVAFRRRLLNLEEINDTS